MGVFAEASDVLQIAVRIEENGAQFYRYAIQIAKEEDAKKMFEHLALEEDSHQKIFKKMLSGITQTELPESYPGEYGEYLRNYTDNNIIFQKELMDKELARIKDTVSALDFAIRREIDSILFYHELKGFVPKDQHKALDEIIAEERKHFIKLSQMREKHQK